MEENPSSDYHSNLGPLKHDFAELKRVLVQNGIFVDDVEQRENLARIKEVRANPKYN